MLNSLARRLSCASALAILFAGLGCSSLWKAHLPAYAGSGTVGRAGTNLYITSTGQLLTPAGTQLELPGMRPQALAFSPDGKLLATSGKTNAMVLIDAATGLVLQRVTLSTNRAEAKAEEKKQKLDPEIPAALQQKHSSATKTNTPASTNSPASSSALISLTGLLFSPDGKHIYLSTAGGSVRSFSVEKSHQVSTPVAIPLPDAKTPKPKKEIPAGLAVSRDSKRLYVAGNLGNVLHELDTDTSKVLRSWDTGVAPYDVLLTQGKAYVSNLGGPRPGTNVTTAPAGLGTKVGVDAERYIPNQGSVTVIDLILGKVKTEIQVELHPSALALSPDGRYVAVANTASDTISVINTATDQIVEKIWTRQSPADLFGAQPNALAFDRAGERLYVCNGTQNAVAVIQFEPEDNASRVIGLIPTGWFPGAVKVDSARHLLCVANIKGLGALQVFKPGERIKLNSKDFFGTVSFILIPSDKELAGMTEIALQNMRYPKMAEAKLPARSGEPARPVPERVGEPSVFKHVFYILKENRTFDQVLGDLKAGNGDSNLCTFGETYTPNQHKIAREFVLLDNTYCAGVQSADGHQWTDSAMVNEYVERQLTSGFPRSYPGGKLEDGMDALCWAASGFIWDNALAHGKTFLNYGEWMISDADWKEKKGHKEKPTWQDFWNDYQCGSNLTKLASHPGIESLRKYSPTNTVGWDLNVPDVMRASEFIKALHQFEAEDQLPNLVMIFLPGDHTGGTRGKAPTPAAQIADNDLAFGQIVDAISHSRFWAESCVFAIEDDPQAGWDHVSGYRTTCYVASPYTKRAQTVSTQYNQVSVVRTIELILGLPPMNQMDATAMPMSECFTEIPDVRPFDCVPNIYRLDQTNPEPKKITNRQLRKDALASARLKLDQPDRCPEDVLNQILWRAMKGTDVPYPKWAVKALADKD